MLSTRKSINLQAQVEDLPPLYVRLVRAGDSASSASRSCIFGDIAGGSLAHQPPAEVHVTLADRHWAASC